MLIPFTSDTSEWNTRDRECGRSFKNADGRNREKYCRVKEKTPYLDHASDCCPATSTSRHNDLRNQICTILQDAGVSWAKDVKLDTCDVIPGDIQIEGRGFKTTAIDISIRSPVTQNATEVSDNNNIKARDIHITKAEREKNAKYFCRYVKQRVKNSFLL